jgi:hypothetical protein
MSAADDDSALDLADQKNRPQDISVQQQRIQAWHPILDPEWMIYAFLILAIIMIPVGTYKLYSRSTGRITWYLVPGTVSYSIISYINPNFRSCQLSSLSSLYCRRTAYAYNASDLVFLCFKGFKLEALSEEVVELSQMYDSVNPEDQLCGIGLEYNANENCTIRFVAPADMEPPVLIYYELTNFYQNHRFYQDSRDDFQLFGEDVEQDAVSAEACDPLNKLGNMTLNPCGLIANTFFNDVFELVGGVDEDGNELKMVEEGIAWTSDKEYRYGMPPGFKMEQCGEDEGCGAVCCENLEFSCETPYEKDDGTCWAYHYPNDDTTQYLHETYPKIISPLDHVTNEHFIVWMRIATRPNFRKLYGYIEQKIPEGTELSFRINLNYVVESFGGSKTLVISTNNVVGGKNPYLGPTFYYMGFFCMACGIIFATKHWFRPRKLGDRKYLQYKED